MDVSNAMEGQHSDTFFFFKKKASYLTRPEKRKIMPNYLLFPNIQSINLPNNEVRSPYTYSVLIYPDYYYSYDY